MLIVDQRGVVIADSSPGGVGADYSTRSEIAGALRGDTEQAPRDSSTLGKEILATAVPVVRDGRPDGAVRITQSVAAVDRAVSSATIGLVLVGLIVLALGLARGRAAGGDHRAAAAAAGVGGAPRGGGRPLGAGPDRRLARAARGRRGRSTR